MAEEIEIRIPTQDTPIRLIFQTSQAHSMRKLAEMALKLHPPQSAPPPKPEQDEAA